MAGMPGRERGPGSRRGRHRPHSELRSATFTRRDPVLSRRQQTLEEGAETPGSGAPGVLPDRRGPPRIVGTGGFFAFLHGEMEQLLDRRRAHESQPAASEQQGWTPAGNERRGSGPYSRGSVSRQPPGWTVHVRVRTGPPTRASAR